MAAASTARRSASRVRVAKGTAAAKAGAVSAAGKTKSLPETSKTKAARKKPLPLTEAEPAREVASETEASSKESGAKPRAAKAKPQTRFASRPRSLVQRVYNTIDGELTKLEKQKGLTSQDRERASRALSQMVNALEKAVEMQRNIAKSKSPGGTRNKEALAHAEDLRREIAERLERLNRKRAASRGSE